MNSKKYVFTDSDLDGVGSFLVLKWLIGDLPYKTTTHKNFREDFVNFLTNNKISDYDIIYICDLNVSEHSDLLNHKNIVVIDHHNGKDNYDDFTKTSLILDSEYPSTTKLVLKYLLDTFPNKKIQNNLTKAKAKLIELINDYDSYKLQYKESIGVNYVLWSYTGNRIQKFIDEFQNGFTEFTLFQKNMITLANKKIKSQFESGECFFYETNINNKPKKLISSVCSHNINEVAAGLLKIHKADIVFIVNPKSKSVSVRKRKGDEVNLNKLAGKLLNGGGHIDSAGGKIGETFLKFTKLFKLVV
jgi:nanoRNase/pAp phosphatase (c-di-AMP/oligoRNAs hydrolase)